MKTADNTQPIGPRPIPGHDGYAADETGHIFSRWRGAAMRKGPVFPWRRLRGSGERPYHRLALFDGAQKRRSCVHVLVCSAFHGERPTIDGEPAQVRHKNGDSHDNRPDNLVWGTATENQRDRVPHDTHVRGERQHKHKLTEADVRYIRGSKKTGVELARELHVTKTTICAVRRRQNWAWVP